jgi:Uma2 family endonuclease
MSNAAPLLTADELEHLAGDDCRHELAAGRLVRMMPVGYRHGRIVAELLSRLVHHLRGRNIGVALSEVGFVLATGPDTVRAPDIAFLSLERALPPDTRGFFRGAPDVAIEILSPEERPLGIRAKVDEYLSAGVQLAVVVDPESRSVTLSRRLLPPVVFRDGDDVIDLGDVIPGFRFELRDIFE